ncbi:hypothetical protein BGW38_009559 [Lunasporangiospora selenospora]|uniref:Uncharacterized protein n=1 Tax=Lunasporangiospora selenospora TaxID=979761 RepID=A0A9P6K7I3_9FUNG|nr:hypothetical protein BGW38_009559 [Lunasporangiospora selenospora]
MNGYGRSSHSHSYPQVAAVAALDPDLVEAVFGLKHVQSHPDHLQTPPYYTGPLYFPTGTWPYYPALIDPDYSSVVDGNDDDEPTAGGDDVGHDRVDDDGLAAVAATT